MSKVDDVSCGARVRKGNYGAQSMDMEQMRKFILQHGTREAIGALEAIGTKKASRGQLCYIFTTFAAGRHQISLGVGQGNKKAPKKAAAKATPAKKAASRPRSASRSVSRSSSRSMNSRNSVQRMLNRFASNERRARNVPVARSPNIPKGFVRRREHAFGPYVLGRRPNMRRPNNRMVAANGPAVNYNYELNNMFANNGYMSGGNNRNNLRGANYINYKNIGRRNKRVNVRAATRFNKVANYLAQRVKPNTKQRFMKRPTRQAQMAAVTLKNLGFNWNNNNSNAVNLKPPSPKKASPPRVSLAKYSMMTIPHVQGFLRVPTIAYNRAGTKAASNANRLARAARYREMLMASELKRRALQNRARLSVAKRAIMANAMLRRALNEVVENAGSKSPSGSANRNIKLLKKALANAPPRKKSSSGSSRGSSNMNNFSPNRKKPKLTGKRAEIMRKLAKRKK